MKKYSVIVSNIGTTLSTNDLSKAIEEYNTYVEISKEKHGTVSGESVTLFDNETGEIIEECIGANPSE